MDSCRESKHTDIIKKGAGPSELALFAWLVPSVNFAGSCKSLSTPICPTDIYKGGCCGKCDKFVEVATFLNPIYLNITVLGFAVVASELQELYIFRKNSPSKKKSSLLGKENFPFAEKSFPWVKFPGHIRVLYSAL